MKGLRFLTLSLLIAAMLFAYGCERKIVNEVANGDDQSLAGCFGCHGEESFDGALLQAEGEWRNSLHASGTSVDYTNRQGQDCTQCHNHAGFLEYLETGDTEPPYDVVSAIHCFTCHAPHARGDMSVRTDAPFTLLNGVVFDHGDANLCANCHHVRGGLEAAVPPTAETVTLSSRFGPHHGPQSDLLVGTHGFEDFPGFVDASTNHAGVVREACLGCHMGNPQQHDGYNVGGHSFNMRFEAHDGSEYTLVGVCADCHSSLAGKSQFDVAGTFQDYDGDGEIEGVQSELDDLAEELATHLAPVLGTSTPFKGGSVVTRRQAGAAWNYISYEEDRSHGVHNPLYIAALLKASIAYLEDNPIVLPTSQEGLAAVPSHN